jgi:hypothetical protein
MDFQAIPESTRFRGLPDGGRELLIRTYNTNTTTQRQAVMSRRGRDAGYPAPPAQIPASGITAQGSYLR